MLRALLVLALAAGADAAWGKKKKENEGAAGVLDDLDEAQHMQQANVDAMGAAAAAGAREYELENIARHQAGELNTAELGFENMKHAMNDPSALAEMAQMMRDPESMRAVKEMMADPTCAAARLPTARTRGLRLGGARAERWRAQPLRCPPASRVAPGAHRFQAQAKQMAEQMKASGGIPGMGDIQKMMQDPAVMEKARNMAQAMYGGGGGAGGDATAELQRLRAENAALRQGASI
jgi:hypothetical protein